MPRSLGAAIAAVLFLLVVATSVRPQLLRLLPPPHRLPPVPGPEHGLDRAPLRLKTDGTPEELRIFLTMISLNIPNGATVGVVLPPPHDGFAYGYWRASYVLAGRTVLLPPQAADISTAAYVAVWRGEWNHPDFAPMWSGYGGTLLKRR